MTESCAAEKAKKKNKKNSTGFFFIVIQALELFPFKIILPFEMSPLCYIQLSSNMTQLENLQPACFSLSFFFFFD